MEYLQHNRIFRPRAMYIGEFNNKYVPLADRVG
jgi:citrate synthase